MRRDFLIFLLVCASSFFIFSKVLSWSTDIVINEIAAYPTSTHEWVEIFNRGTSTIDLVNWKFLETEGGIKMHSLKAVTSSDSLVAPGEYAVIAQDAEQFLRDTPTFPMTSSLFDSSWISLLESGEEIGLQDASGTVMEQLMYISSTQFSLERKNPTVDEYSSLNWFEHPSGHSAGAVNWATIAPTSTPTSAPSSFWSYIKINEIMPDPDSGDEWVELYNSATSSMNLFGGTLCDNRSGSCTIANLSGIIAAQSWLVVPILGNKLNNTGDSVILKRPDGTVADQVVYAGSLVPKTNQTLARKNDGLDTDNDSDWAVTVQSTPNAANVISAPANPNPPSGGGPTTSPPPNSSGLPPSPNLPKVPTISTNPASAIFLNEILPNPEGSDTKDEFIELKNQTNQEVSVQGWKLVVGSKYYQLSGTVLPNQFLILPVTLTKISLRNTGGDEVLLYATNDVLVDRVVYGSAPTGKSFSRADEGKWQWSKTITKGSGNVIALDESESSSTSNSEEGITLDVVVPKTVEVGKEVIFDASKTADKRKGTLYFIWNFSDTSSTWSGVEVKRSFLNEGKISGTLSASSTSGSSGKKTFSFTVVPAQVHDTGEIKISEVLANPEGADKGEFIELFNPLDREVNLNGWQIKLKNGKKFVFEDDVIIHSDEYLMFKQSETKLSLNNTDETITLLDADEKTIDTIRITKSPEAQSYSRFGTKWKFVDPTPGEKNNDTSAAVPESEDKKTSNNSSSKTTAGSKALGDYELATIAEVRPMLKGVQVIVQGTMISKPGAVGAKTFYIMDEESGIAVYAGRKELPQVKIGDQVEVQGAVSSAYGAPRLTAHAIVVLKSGEMIETEPLEEELGEEFAGRLVQVEGEVTKSLATSANIESDMGEILVAIKKSTGLTKTSFKVGERIEVVGIIEQTKDGEWQIVPRGKDDVKVVEVARKNEDENQEEMVSAQPKTDSSGKGSSSSTTPYVKMGVSGIVGALLVKILSAERMAIMLGGIKKLFVKKEDEDEVL